MNHYVILTGASGGIGKEIARRFLEDGDTVVAVCHRHADTLIPLSERFGKRLIVRSADLADREDLRALIGCCIKELPQVDLLINNAGIALQQLFVDMTDEEWDRIWQINVTAPVFLSRAVLPGMLSRGSGQIINISSVWGERGASCEVAYSAAKAALLGFTKALAKEVGLMGVRVNAVSPGVIDTEMISGFSPETRAELAAQTALGRLGTGADIAGAVWLLTRPEAGYITGTVLSADGGFIG